LLRRSGNASRLGGGRDGALNLFLSVGFEEGVEEFESGARDHEQAANHADQEQNLDEPEHPVHEGVHAAIIALTAGVKPNERMELMFRHAILRRPGANFAEGETSVDLGAPVWAEVEKQYQQYCNALEKCGVQIEVLAADAQHPDSTFVEDTAVLTKHSAIFTRPGAASREGEVRGIRPAVEKHFKRVHEIVAPATLDGGDICEADNHFFIGVSRRTNEAGAQQLAKILESEGYTTSCVDIRRMTSILHLKSGVVYLRDKHLVVMDEMADWPQFAGYDIIRVGPEESYAANCVLVNDHVLLPAGYPRLQGELERRRYKIIALEMSEFRKMDGGLSCLSLRF
jgi:dimethylargininase